MRRALLIYNPYAGRFPSRMIIERAAGVFKQHGWQIHLEQSLDGEHITALAKQAALEEMDALLVVGGDGSVNLAAAGVLGSKTALGVLPAGTANVWAQELGLTSLNWTRWIALEDSALQLCNAPVRIMDVGDCNGKHFLLWAGVGLDAFIVHRIEPRERWEKQFAVVQYTASAVWNAGFWHGMQLHVEADGEKISGHFMLAVVSNIHLYAGGLAKLSPNARLDDGLMDLWLFKGETLGDTVQRAWDLWGGRHVQSDQVIQIPFRRLELESDSPLFVQLDGEPVRGDGRVTIEVHPKALRVLVPERSLHSLFGDSADGASIS